MAPLKRVVLSSPNCVHDPDISQLMILTLTLNTPRHKLLEKHLSTFMTSEDMVSAVLEYRQTILT
jgi:hypothetical protein